MDLIVSSFKDNKQDLQEEVEESSITELGDIEVEYDGDTEEQELDNGVRCSKCHKVIHWRCGEMSKESVRNKISE